MFPWASGHSTAIKSKEDATGWRSWHSPVGVDRGKGVSSRCQCGQSKAGQWEHMVAEVRKGQQGLPRRSWAAEPFTRAEKQPGKCSWKALPEVLEEDWAVCRKRLRECSSCGCGHWAVPWVRRTAGRASLGDRRAVLLKCSKQSRQGQWRCKLLPAVTWPAIHQAGQAVVCGS